MPELDGIRAVAVLLVLTVHTIPETVPGGFLGVDLFFALSGYLITTILKSEYEARGEIRFANFYMRRFLRLAPALYLLLLIYAFVAIVKPVPNLSEVMISILAAGLYCMNWVRAFHLGPENMLGHTWSLAIEEQFYLVWPILLLFLMRSFGPTKRLWVICALIVISELWRLYLVLAGADAERIFNGFDTRAETLLFGCLLGLREPRASVLVSRLWFIPALVLTFFAFSVAWSDRFEMLVGIPVAGFCSCWIIWAVLDAQKKKSIPILSNPILIYIGRISYGFYLWHYPVVLVVTKHIHGYQSLIVAGVLSLICASISFYVIERRILSLKRHFSS